MDTTFAEHRYPGNEWVQTRSHFGYLNWIIVFVSIETYINEVIPC